MLRQRRTTGWVLATALPLVVLTVLVALPWAPLLHLDAVLSDRAHAFTVARPTLVGVLTGFAQTFQPLVVRLALLAVALLLLLRRRRVLGLWVLASTLGEVVTVALLKLGIGRPRPDLDPGLQDATGFAFPSGHASSGALVAGVVAVVVTRLVRRTWLRVACLVPAVLFGLVMGLHRVLLGVHYPTDVVGSYLAVALVMAVTAGLLGGVAHSPSPAP
ncbi:MAG: phosphatase PAP2 family protein, partial [Actinomycetota bacterium]|nr:phosphatase PAP2 family protein [Actinomycetota bacterium]